MRMRHPLWAPDDPTTRGSGQEPTASPEENRRPERQAAKTPPVTEPSSQRTSGPGPNDLTRGLP